MASIIKVDTIQDQDGNNIISEAANTITIGASGDTITIPSGATLANSGIVTGFQSTGIDDNATSTAITIDSSQNVDVAGNIKFADNGRAVFGAGSDLQIWHTGSHSYIMDSGTGNLYLQGSTNIIFQNPNNKTLMSIVDNGDISFYEDTGTTAKFFWDASTERLGIGTSSPDRELTVGNVANARIGILSNDNVVGASQLQFGDPDNSQIGRIMYEHDDNKMTFWTNNTERMRIDSSGNVLVGKTATGLSTIGVEARPIGLFSATRDSNTPGYFTRTTTDGDIVQFLKDTTKVGSIFSRSGVVSGIILDPRAGGNGLLGQTGAIIPVDETQTREDNATDLGNSTYRWKDLYLGGGLYVGGTASANYLDDYEEGSWTPTVNTANGFSPGATNYTGTSAPRYTKIGNRVFLQCQVQMGNSSGNVALDDSITMTNLPFTPADVERNTVTEYRYNNNCAYMTSFLTATPSIISIVRFIKGTILRNGGSINININYTV